MTPEEIEFVKKMDSIAHSLNARPTAEETGHLLTLLVREAAMREKAEFEKNHCKCWQNTAGQWICTGSGTDIRHDWGGAHYQKAVRERWGLE